MAGTSQEEERQTDSYSDRKGDCPTDKQVGELATEALASRHLTRPL